MSTIAVDNSVNYMKTRAESARKTLESQGCLKFELLAKPLFYITVI